MSRYFSWSSDKCFGAFLTVVQKPFFSRSSPTSVPSFVMRVTYEYILVIYSTCVIYRVLPNRYNIIEYDENTVSEHSVHNKNAMR